MADLIIPRKRCSACGLEYPATPEYFHKNGKRLRSVCKSCHNARTKAPAREWNIAHPERRRASQKRYYINHHDQELARFRSRPTEINRVRVKRWRIANPRKHAIKEQRRRALKLNAAGSHTVEDEQLQFRSQRGLCWWCGNPLDPNNYHVDHRIALAKGGSNNAGNICIACPKCNLQKHAKYPWEFNGRLI